MNHQSRQEQAGPHTEENSGWRRRNDWAQFLFSTGTLLGLSRSKHLCPSVMRVQGSRTPPLDRRSVALPKIASSSSCVRVVGLPVAFKLKPAPCALAQPQRCSNRALLHEIKNKMHVFKIKYTVLKKHGVLYRWSKSALLSEI